MTYNHRDIVIAYMDGKRIQMKGLNGWVDLHFFDGKAIHLAFCNDTEYRVKPDTKKYRVALFKDGVTFTSDDEEQSKQFEKHTNFVRWLTDWVKYEV